MKRLLLFVYIAAPWLVQAQTTYPITLHSSNSFVTMQVPQPVFDGWNGKDVPKSFNREQTKSSELTKALYGRFADDFDFIVFVMDAATAAPTAPAVGEYIGVSHNIKGVGVNSYNNTSTYGSAGRLKGHITLWHRGLIENGPFLHELMHYWGNFGIPTEGTFDLVNFFQFIPHWGFSGCGGQLGGFDQTTLKTNVDGDANKYQGNMPGKTSFGPFANGGNAVPYSNFELYLMGMIPASEITPFDVFTGISVDPTERPNNIWNGKFKATKRTTYNSASIASLLGTRVPDSATAPKEFKILTVLLTTSATPDAATLATFAATIERMGRKGDNGIGLYNFSEATGGRGSLSFDLTPSVTPPVNPPPVDPPVTALNDETQPLSIESYPNPIVAGEELSLKINSELTAQSVRIVVYDMVGREVVLTHSIATARERVVAIPTKALPRGTYLLSVRDIQGQLLKSSRFIVVEGTERR